MDDFASLSQGDQALYNFLLRIGVVKKSSVLRGFSSKSSGLLGFLELQGVIKQSEIVREVADALLIDLVELNRSKQIEVMHLKSQLPFAKISLGLWRELGAIPLSNANSVITIGMINPLDYEARITLEYHLNQKINLAICREDQIRDLFSRWERGGSPLEINDILSDENLHNDSLESSSKNDEELVTGQDAPQAAPVVRLVNKIFRDSISIEASDIHISPEANEVVVRVRVDGILRVLFQIPNSLRDGVTSRIKLLAKLDIAEKRLPQDGKLRINTNYGKRDIRISTIPSLYGENVVARVLGETKRHGINTLGLSPDNLQTTVRILKSSCKLFLVTGPTGSGKTSSLYAFLESLRDGTKKIVTLEDPIEYRLSGITQIQVSPKLGFNFAQGLRAVLRQDPDIVMVGEIRDSETAQIALQAAQTGHFVLSTLHTNSCLQTITRLVDLGLSPYLIGSILGGVISQRLVRRLCDCKQQCNITSDHSLYQKLQSSVVYESKGCAECSYTGYRGRIGLFSLLEITPKLSDLISKGDTSEIYQEATNEGFVDLIGVALDAVSKGITTLNEVERVLGDLTVPTVSQPVQAKSVDYQPSRGLRQKVLLVDDDENILFLYQSLFEQEQFDVSTASSGTEALKLAFNEPFDVVITDLMMPGMTGLQLTQKITANPATRSTPIVVLTANTSEEHELATLQTGASDFVSKTVAGAVLIARVQGLLRNSLR